MSSSAVQLNQVATQAAWAEDVAYAFLRGRILDAELLPNTHHLEDTIDSSVPLSAESAHQVALRLESDGLLRVDGIGGFWITAVTVAEVQQTFGEIAKLEARAAHMAAAGDPSSVSILALHDAISRLEDALYRQDLIRSARAEHHFHRSLVQSCGDKALISSALRLTEPVHHARMLRLRLGEIPTAALESYRRLVASIEGGDGDRAHHIVQNIWAASTEQVATLLTENHMHSATDTGAVIVLTD